MKTLRFCALLLLLPITGCIGAADYSCKGVPDGAMCLSVKDTYQVTNNDGYKFLGGVNKSSESGTGAEISNANQQSHEITVPEQAVRSLDGSHAVPVRIPAQIMRVWYGPYEGTKGQASFMPGVGYLEMTPRKWVFSKPNLKLARQIQPLSVNTQMKSFTNPGYGDPKPAGLNDLKPKLPSQQKGKATTKEKRK